MIKDKNDDGNDTSSNVSLGKSNVKLMSLKLTNSDVDAFSGSAYFILTLMMIIIIIVIIVMIMTIIVIP